MSKYWSETVRRLDPYVPGEQPQGEKLIKLNTNENPYGPSPQVIAALQQAAGENLRLYPDPQAQALSLAIAQTFEVDPECVFAGNGSDEVLAHAFAAFFTGARPLLMPDISYSFYPVYCRLYDITPELIPLNDALEIVVKDFDRPNGGIILANPNAPTSIAMGIDQLEALVGEHADSVVIVDEAYVDFGATSAVSLIGKYPNLLVIQTFSKSRSLAGLRLGYALGHPDLIQGLVRVKDSFNSYPLDTLAQVAGIAALGDVAYFESTCQKIIATRDNSRQVLQESGFDVLPSRTNFLFARHPKLAGEYLLSQLRDQGILVRHWSKPRIDPYIRISIGTDSEMDTLHDTLRQIVQDQSQLSMSR